MFTCQANTDPSKERIAGSLLLLTFGMFFVMCSDCQKYFTIQTIRQTDPNAKPLITEGMFKWTRNPNYMGEIIVFSSFCFLVGETSGWISYIFIWVTLFWSRMSEKDERLKRKEGAEAYFKRTWMLFPRFTTCWFKNLLIYSNILGIIYVIYVSDGVENVVKNTMTMIKTHCHH
jgi:protein-S-isoprenylcysteine O-methyltransferase Ste14